MTERTSPYKVEVDSVDGGTRPPLAYPFEDDPLVITVDSHDDAAAATDTREQLAAYAHAAWSGWMRYFFGKLTIRRDGSFIVPVDYAAALNFQMARRYEDLFDDEKESDRAEADKMLAIVSSHD